MNDPIQIPKRWRGRRWSALATSVRARNPICERCKERFSAEVHHTMPLHKGGSLYDPRNLVALCKECHHDVTKRIISQITNPHYSSNNATSTAEPPSPRGTALRGQPWKYPKSTNNRESLGARIKWQPKKIK